MLNIARETSMARDSQCFRHFLQGPLVVPQSVKDNAMGHPILPSYGGVGGASTLGGAGGFGGASGVGASGRTNMLGSASIKGEVSLRLCGY